MANIHDFAQEHGFMLPSTIQHGQLARFSRTGGRDRDSFYKVFDSGVAILGDWHERGADGRPIKHIFKPEGVNISQADIDREVRAFLESQEMTQAVEADNCRRLYDSLPPVSESFGYLSAKGVQPCAGLKQDGDTLVVPFYDGEMNISTIESIFPDSQKRWHKGARKQGCFFPIGFEKGKLFSSRCYLVEGVATGLSVFEATGKPVVVAGDCGNLIAVSRLFPRAVVIADHDPQTGNAGLKSAKATGLPVVLVEDENYPTRPLDANDYAKAFGLDALREFIESHLPEPFFVDLARCLKDYRHRDELVNQWIPKGKSLVCVFGISGGGKTFFVLDIALHLALGFDTWHGFKAQDRPCHVVLLVGEDFEGCLSRINGFTRHYGRTQEDVARTFHVSPVALTLDNEENLKTIEVEIEALGVKPDMVILDNLARYMEADENDSTSAKSMVRAFDSIATKFDCPILYVQHIGVSLDAQNRQRGSSVFRAACDVEIKVGKTSSGFLATQTKKKNGKELSMGFKALTVGTGETDSAGKPVTTLILEENPEPGEETALTGAKLDEQRKLLASEQLDRSLLEDLLGYCLPTLDDAKREKYFISRKAMRSHFCDRMLERELENSPLQEPEKDATQKRKDRYKADLKKLKDKVRKSADRESDLSKKDSVLNRFIKRGWVTILTEQGEIKGLHVNLPEFNPAFYAVRTAKERTKGQLMDN